MIKYDKFWDTLKAKGVSQYDLYTRHGVPRSLLDRLRKNKAITTDTINRLCNILHCDVGDIMTHEDDEDTF